MLELDWLFECNNDRLLRFYDKKALAVQKAVAPIKMELDEEITAAEEATKAFSSFQQQLQEPWVLGFHVEFQDAAAHLVELGKRELEDRRLKIKKLQANLQEVSSKVMLDLDHSTVSCPSPAVALEEREVELDSMLGVPVIELEIRRALSREWKHFREHHYKDHRLKGDSVSFVGLVNGRAAAFTAITIEPLHFVLRGALSGLWPDDHGYPDPWTSTSSPRLLFREHRTVVLPDFQGMGLAPLLCDAVGQYFLHMGHDFTSQTVHPFYGSYRDRSPFWQALPSNRTESSAINGNLKYSHVFVGSFRRDGELDPDKQNKLEARVKLELQ